MPPASHPARTSLLVALSVLFAFLIHNPAVHHLLLLPAVATNSYTTAGISRSDVRDPEWSYANMSAWPPLCKNGVQQSPISFASHATQHHIVLRSDLKPLEFSQECTFEAEKTSLKIVNEVNTISARFIPLDDPDGGAPNLCTTRDPTDEKSPLYRFMALHFHAPGEHEFPHGQPDAELHIVFASIKSTNKTKRMVIAVPLLSSDKTNTTSVQAFHHVLVDGALPPKHAITTCTLTNEIAIDGFLPMRRSYLAYNGSVTTPPCTENVRFFVMTVPQIISKLALERLVQAFNGARPENREGNRRPVQPLNGRYIYRYVDEEHKWNKKSKEAVKDYYGKDLLRHDIWSADTEVSPNISNAPRTTRAVKEDFQHIGDNSTTNSPGGIKKWSHVLSTSGAIFFTSAACVLLVVTIILYRRWTHVTAPGVELSEREPLSHRTWDYGATQV